MFPLMTCKWYYVGPDFSPQEYFWYATLPFSTVLPAVLSTRQWFISFQWILQRYGNLVSFTLPYPRLLAGSILLISAIRLTGIGVWPNYLFDI
jgi:hypothetical protein